jgi:hypothetical protein
MVPGPDPPCDKRCGPGPKTVPETDKHHKEGRDKTNRGKRVRAQTGNPDRIDEIVRRHQEHDDDHGAREFHDRLLGIPGQQGNSEGCRAVKGAFVVRGEFVFVRHLVRLHFL